MNIGMTWNPELSVYYLPAPARFSTTGVKERRIDAKVALQVTMQLKCNHAYTRLM